MDVNALRDYIETLVSRGSTQAELARKCDISSAAFSQFLSGKYGAKEDALAEKIATGLNWYTNTWKSVDTVSSYRQVEALPDGGEEEPPLVLHQQPQRKRKDAFAPGPV